MTRIASFFSGIGGLELGLEAALDGEVVFQCESDPYARSILERHWPAAARHPDITTLRGDEIPHADIWCGGFPCQDISVAGKQEGIRGARSGLFFKWMRLVRAVRPRFLVMENVPAILAGDNLGPVLGELAEAGYDAEWDVLGAWQVGAPHRRDRFFLIGWRSELGRALADADNARSDNELRAGRDVIGCGSEMADSTSPRLEGHYEEGIAGGLGAWPAEQLGAGCLRSDADVHAFVDDAGDELRGSQQRELGVRGGRDGWTRSGPWGADWLAEPDVGRVAHGIPARVDRLRCLGNAVVPQCAYVIGIRLKELMQAGRGGLRYPGARGPCGMGAH